MRILYNKEHFFEESIITDFYNTFKGNNTLYNKINLNIQIIASYNDIIYDYIKLSTPFELELLPNNINIFFKIFPDLHNVISHYKNNSKISVNLEVKNIYSSDIIKSEIILYLEYTLV